MSCGGRQGPECWRHDGCRVESYVEDSRRVMKSASVRAARNGTAVDEAKVRAARMTDSQWAAIASRKVVIRGTRVDVRGPDSAVSRTLVSDRCTTSAEKERDNAKSAYVARVGGVAEAAERARLGGVSQGTVRREILAAMEGAGVSEGLALKVAARGLAREYRVRLTGVGQRVLAAGGTPEVAIRAIGAVASDLAYTVDGSRGRASVDVRATRKGAKGSGSGRQRAEVAVSAANRSADFGGAVERARQAANDLQTAIGAGAGRKTKRELRARLHRLATKAGLDSRRMISTG